MDTTYTDITVVADRSGSMGAIVDGANEGLKGFIASQKALPGKVRFSLWQFDNNIEKVYEDSAAPPEHTIVPRGMTALYDCLSEAVDSTGKRLATMPESSRPSKVVVLVVSDGQENFSKMSASTLSEKIKRQNEDYGWQFVFIGTNQDAVLSAKGIGINSNSSLSYTYTNSGARQSYTSTSDAVSNYRTGTKSCVEFTDEDRKVNATSAK